MPNITEVTFPLVQSARAFLRLASRAIAKNTTPPDLVSISSYHFFRNQCTPFVIEIRSRRLQEVLFGDKKSRAISDPALAFEN
jgi:hypothetical protein